MEIRPIDFCDEEAYCSFLASFKNDDNPFVAPETTREVTDFKVFVENSRAQRKKSCSSRLFDSDHLLYVCRW